MKTSNKIFLWAYILLLGIPMFLVAYLGCVLWLCYFTLQYLTIYAFVLTIIFVLIYKGLRGYTVPLLLLSSIVLVPLVTWLLMDVMLFVSNGIYTVKETFRVKHYTKNGLFNATSYHDERYISFVGKEYGFTFTLPSSWKITDTYMPTKANAIVPDEMAVHLEVQSPNGNVVVINSIPKKGATLAQNFPQFGEEKKQGATLSERYLDTKKAKALGVKVDSSYETYTRLYILTSERAIDITAKYPRENVNIAKNAKESLEELLASLKIYDSFIRIGGLHIPR